MAVALMLVTERRAALLSAPAQRPEDNMTTKSAKPKPNGKHEPVHDEEATSSASADAPTNIITYEEAVREAKEILARHDKDWTRLGELADQVNTHYGKKKLQKWAEEIDIAYCTARRHRDVYRACKKIEDELAPLGRFSYSVLRELAGDPEAAKTILRESPKLTKRAAREKLKEYRENNGKGRERGKRRKDKSRNNWQRPEVERWLRRVHSLANDVVKYAAAMPQDEVVARILQEIVEPTLVPLLRDGGTAFFAIADLLEAHIAKPERKKHRTLGALHEQAPR
jgi:hypothetical protein